MVDFYIVTILFSLLTFVIGMIIGVTSADRQWHEAVRVKFRPGGKKKFTKNGWKFHE